MIDEIIAAKGHCNIVDIGGEFDYWRPFLPELDGLAISVLLVNLNDKSEPFADSRFQQRYGNACNLGILADGEFDLAHSNSVIEHVGRWAEMKAMASEVKRVATAYYVQTPYYWFPMEPHYRTIGYQWLPEQWRARLHTKFELGYFPKADTISQAMDWTNHAVLLDKLQLATLFSDGQILSERVFGLTKSIMAVRQFTPAGS